MPGDKSGVFDAVDRFCKKCKTIIACETKTKFSSYNLNKSKYVGPLNRKVSNISHNL